MSRVPPRSPQRGSRNTAPQGQRRPQGRHVPQQGKHASPSVRKNSVRTKQRQSRPVSETTRKTQASMRAVRHSKNLPYQIDTNVLRPTQEKRARQRGNMPHQSGGGRGSVFRTIGHGFAYLAAKSKIAVAAIIIVAAIGVGVVADNIIHDGRIYDGVSVGSLDLSGKTADEARELITQAYEPMVSENRAYIFANDEAASTVSLDPSVATEDDSDDITSLAEAQQNKEVWVVDSEVLDTTLPVDTLVQEALDVGRNTGGWQARLGAMTGGWNIPVRAEFNDDKVDLLANDIDQTIGDPRTDYDVEIEDGVASVVEGHDGAMVDRDALFDAVNASLFSENEADRMIVAYAEYAPSRTTAEQAQAAADQINAIIDSPVSFTYEGVDVTVDGDTLQNWISTEIVPDQDGNYDLRPYVDPSKARPTLLELLRQDNEVDTFSLSFENSDGAISALTDGNVVVPQLNEAVLSLSQSLFSGNPGVSSSTDASSSSSSDQDNQSQGSASQSPEASVPIEQSTAPAVVDFEDALNSGLVEVISTYTTEYDNSSSVENRVKNIHHAADLVNDSIIPANGGLWSFNETAGNSNEENGFLEAGVIVNNELSSDFGGGVCQVATTVFNAVYEAGFPVKQRFNHSLYLSTYPTGRDAAVAYPDLDLIWENDSSSDVLLRVTYTDTTVTATLYGVDRDYSVSTKVGDWTEGKPYSTRYKYDNTLASGSSYVETSGTNGKNITVYRTVKDRNGNIVLEDAFASQYPPIDQVIVQGTG